MCNFDSIRPYTDQEVPIAIERILRSRMFPIFVHYFLDKDVNEIHNLCRRVHTVNEFQLYVMKPLLQELMQQTTSQFSASGFSHLQHDRAYLYISNHRDIVLDAAWLDVALHEAGFPLMEITFGSNLMTNQFNIDLGKINRMFKFVRGGNRKEFYNNMLEVSQYMRHVITDNNRSVWIAQRNGRTKNGDDRTEVALLKMLAKSSSDTFIPNFSALNICPVAVSYEYESCDFLKTVELYQSRDRAYVKSKNEDMHSIHHGLMQYKGDVHFEVLPPITVEELSQCEHNHSQDKFTLLAQLINQRIYKGYRLHKTNYIAFDILNHDTQFVSYYSSADKSDFENYMSEGLSNLKMPQAINELENIFLNIYAQPVMNALACAKTTSSVGHPQGIV